MADITVRVAAKDFIKSTGPTGVTSAVKGNPLITQGSGHTIEWKVTLPKAGKWRLHALMSSHISNSCHLFINGAQQDGTILGEVTNGASSDTQHYFSYGPFDFKAGENVFAIKCLKAQPSLWEFGFSLEQEATAPAPAPNPAPAATTPVEATKPEPKTDNTFIRLPSKDFTSATPGTAGDDPGYGGTVCAASTTPFLEYKVNLPKAGKWYFHVSMAAQDSRPATLTINGIKQTQPVCGNITGSWTAETRRWFVYGPFDYKQGDNVFRLDFANCMPHLKEFGFSESMLGVANATVWAADLVAPRDIVTIGDGTYSNLIYTSKAKPSYIEWKVNLPEAGQYTLHALLTAAESRPGTLTLNGVKQTGEILGQNTGSWYSDKLTWVQHGPYEFKQGENVLRVDFANYHAHLRELGFSRAKAAEKPVPSPVEPPKLPEKRNIGGVVNEFAGVTAIDGNTLTIGGNTNPFNPGDRVLVIQMAGASIDTANNDKFGSLTNLGGAGHYVWAKVVSVSDKNVKVDAADLRSFDVKGAVQIVRACAHDGDIAVTGNIAAPQWNGATGGVVVIESAGTIELAEDIDASSRGFVGGPKSPAGGIQNEIGYTYAAAACAGNKGAGIALLGAEHVGGRGPAANGGGGGNALNAGGGGGGNGGTGGRGASEYEHVGGGCKVNGGLGGRALDYADRAFMGGGGGAGQDNNNQSSGGGNGGGIIILRANAITGNAGRFLRANGGAAGAAAADGGGGGGAGGTILLDAPTVSGSFTVQANGGRGGDCAAEHGYGAGGGGGTIRSQKPLPASIAATVLPGDAGSCGRPRGHIVAEKGIVGLLPERPVAPAAPSADEWEKARAALEARIAALEAELAKCSGCCAKIDALAGDLAALSARLDERDAKCAVHAQKIDALEKQLADLIKAHEAIQKALAEQERSNLEQERKLLEQDKKLAEQERSNVEQERKLLTQDKKLAEQEKSNIEQERKLLEQDKLLAEQERKNVEQERTLFDQDKKLSNQGRKIADLEELLAALEGKLAKCGDCETKIVDQQKTIADLTDRLAKLEEARVAPPAPPVEEKPALPPVWPPASTPARMGISYIHFVGLEKNTQGDEYIEIKNTGGTAQDVTGWRVRAGSASQEFVFPKGSIVEPGAACRVYTNRAGSFSFNAKRAVWNDTGDTGMLYNATGTMVAEYGYGTKETRTLESIKATYGVENMQVVYDDAQISKQKRKNDKIDFLTAVERAIRSLLEDPADAEGFNAANQVRDNFDGVPPNASAEVLQRFIRAEMNKGKLIVLSNEVTDLELTTKEQWIFQLDPGMGDMHWVIVDRMGAKAAYQEIT